MDTAKFKIFGFIFLFLFLILPKNTLAQHWDYKGDRYYSCSALRSVWNSEIKESLTKSTEELLYRKPTRKEVNYWTNYYYLNCYSSSVWKREEIFNSIKNSRERTQLIDWENKIIGKYLKYQCRRASQGELILLAEDGKWRGQNSFKNVLIDELNCRPHNENSNSFFVFICYLFGGGAFVYFIASYFSSYNRITEFIRNEKINYYWLLLFLVVLFLYLTGLGASLHWIIPVLGVLFGVYKLIVFVIVRKN